MGRHLIAGLALAAASACGGSLDGGDAPDASRDGGRDGDEDPACARVECGAGRRCVEGVCVAVSHCDDVVCPDPSSVCDPQTGACVPGVADLDGDGFSIRDGDCHDGDADIHPGATETCDGVDEDCDGEVDQGLVVDGGWSAWGPWSECTARCGGGTRERSRSCTSPEPSCGGADCAGEPTEGASCNTQPCCSTDHAAMEAYRRCSGTTGDIIAWVQFHFGLDDGSLENRRQCAEQCTAWASGSHSSWCCDLTEDRTTGTSWSCAAHTTTSTSSYSDPDSVGSYAVIGRCE